MRLKFDLNNNVEMPEIVLGKRNYDKLGSIVNVDNLSYEYNLMSADSVSFTVYKELNYQKEQLWNEIKERRLIWLKEFDEWFQIDVVTNDENSITKEVTATSLCEAELSQIYIRSTEINTEDDIAREDYVNPTIFYKPSNPDESLLHRILKVVPNYTIKYVSDTLYNIQRMFSIDGTTVYDALTGDIADEVGCLFLFDSTDRSISVYDLQTNCNHCGYRGAYTDICPECGSTDLNYGYGNDTTIFVDSETLAENISLSGNQDEVKNYIKVCGGDDIIDAAISACNPTGTQYIYAFSDRDKEDMSNELSEKLEEYLTEYTRLTSSYQEIMKNIYDALDEQLELESNMMPDIQIAETTAKQELAKLTASNLNPIAVQDVSIASIYTVDNAVLGMAKCIINSTVYKIEITDSSLTSQTWKGKFRLTNYSDENDTAENTGYITIAINDDYGYYIEQKIRKAIDRDDIYLVDIFDVKTDLDVFTAELKKYCLNRLTSFESAYQSVIDVLIEANCGNESVYGDIYNDLYLPYYNKLTAIQQEITVRIAEIESVDINLSALEKSRLEITQYLNLENYLGSELWKELCLYRREDSFENSNYISDGLNNAELLQKARELLDKAKIEAVTASTLQMSISTTLINLLAIEEFNKLTGMFEGGNWIRVAVDDKIYRLRLIHYKLDFSGLQNLEVEFSDITETANGLNDTKSLMEKVSSMATNFSYVAHQAEQGAKSFTELDSIRNDGLNAALYNISTSVNQDFIIDEHGITGRQWDDILGAFSPEQVKFTNNCLVYTDNYWETAKAALGKITYYDPVLNETKEKYGLLADAVIAGILMGNDIIGGNIYSENYSSDSGTHINLNDGTFSFAGGKLTYDEDNLNLIGTITTDNITATGGTIGGFTIGSSAIYNGTNSLLSTISGIYLGTDGIRSYLSSSSYVNIAKGVLYAIGADISGTITTSNITATGGTIGGWSITSTKIYAGDETTGVAAIQYPRDAVTWVFAAGGTSHSSYSDCPFKVSKSGVLYATDADISGKITTSDITATGGTIGGFTIGSTNINSYSTDNLYRVVIGSYNYDTANHNAIAVQSRTSASDSFTSHFRVRYNGSLYADNVDISGKITTSDINATGGVIGGISIGNGLYYSGTSAADGFGFWKNGQHPSNGSSIIIHAGANNTNIGGAPFRVYQNGDLYCSNANITNANITGGSFSIGSNFNVTSAGVLSASNVNISGAISSNNATITGGSLKVGNNFSVDSSGVLTAKSGVIGGWTIEDSEEFSGCLKGYDGGTYGIRLFPKGIQYTGDNGAAYTFFLVIYDSGGSHPVGGLTTNGWIEISG